MLVISSREFRDNQKKYFDLADQNEQIVVQRGKKRAYVLVPVSEVDRMSTNPELIERIRKAEKEFEAGKTITIKDPNNIWKSIV